MKEELLPGDVVKFKDEEGKGIIERIEGNKAFVKDEDGFIIEYNVNELIKVSQKTVETPYNEKEFDVRKNEEIIENKVNINVGDNVKFLDDVGYGVIEKLENNVAYVKTNDGFLYEYDVSKLIKIEKENKNVFENTKSKLDKSQTTKFNKELNFGTLKSMTLKNLGQKETFLSDNEFNKSSYKLLKREEKAFDKVINKEIFHPKTEKKGVLSFTFIPVFLKTKDEIQSINLFFNNYSEYRLNTNIFLVSNNLKERIIFSGIVLPKTENFIHTFKFRDRNISDEFEIVVQYIAHKICKIGFYKELKFSFSKNEIFNKEKYRNKDDIKILKYSVKFLVKEGKILDNIIQKDIMEKRVIQKTENNKVHLESISKSSKINNNIQDELLEVDLSAEVLTKDQQIIDPDSILKSQIMFFRKKLDECIQNKVKKVIFIHERDNSKLKLELRKILFNELSLDYKDLPGYKSDKDATLIVLF